MDRGIPKFYCFGKGVDQYLTKAILELNAIGEP
jgi:hypothetical protein